MKTDSRWRKLLKVRVVSYFLFLCMIYGASMFVRNRMNRDYTIRNQKIEIATTKLENIELKDTKVVKTALADTTVVEETPKATDRNIVYDNMTIQELSAKLDRSLNSTLSGKGYLFASISLELGVDPYLAVAIVLEETGCKWDCSNLVKQCNNVGGQKGGTVKCNGGAYRYYPTLDEGIYGFIENLARNYYAQGLITPEQMNSKYAASKAWSTNVNNYIAKIKAN